MNDPKRNRTRSPIGKYRKQGRMTVLERMVLACSPTEPRRGREIIEHLPEGTNENSVTYSLWSLELYRLCTREQQDGIFYYTLTEHGKVVRAILLAELAVAGDDQNMDDAPQVQELHRAIDACTSIANSDLDGLKPETQAYLLGMAEGIQRALDILGRSKAKRSEVIVPDQPAQPKRIDS